MKSKKSSTTTKATRGKRAVPEVVQEEVVSPPAKRATRGKAAPKKTPVKKTRAKVSVEILYQIFIELIPVWITGA